MKEQTKRVQIGEDTYLIRLMDAKQQTHVGRRIAPLVTTLGISFGTIRGVLQKEVAPEDLIPSMAPVSMVLANMKDEDIDFIMATCLGQAQRMVPDGGTEKWAPMMAGPQMMFNLELLATWQLIFEVVRFSMGNFLTELIERGISLSSSPSDKAA